MGTCYSQMIKGKTFAYVCAGLSALSTHFWTSLWEPNILLRNKDLLLRENTVPIVSHFLRFLNSSLWWSRKVILYLCMFQEVNCSNPTQESSIIGLSTVCGRSLLPGLYSFYMDDINGIPSCTTSPLCEARFYNAINHVRYFKRLLWASELLGGWKKGL